MRSWGDARSHLLASSPPEMYPRIRRSRKKDAFACRLLLRQLVSSHSITDSPPISEQRIDIDASLDDEVRAVRHSRNGKRPGRNSSDLLVKVFSQVELNGRPDTNP